MVKNGLIFAATAAAILLTIASSVDSLAAKLPSRGLDLAGATPSNLPADSLGATPQLKLNAILDAELKSRQMRAFTRSIMVPGLGQLGEGRKAVGYLFLGAEGIIIGTLVGLRIHANRLEDDYLTYAHEHAGVPSDREHQFYVDLGNWMNTDGYNEQRLRDRDFEAMYRTQEDRWQWDSDANRRSFKRMRISSDEARNNATIAVGALLLNHFISAIEATNGIDSQLKVSAASSSHGGTVGLTYFP